MRALREILRVKLHPLQHQRQPHRLHALTEYGVQEHVVEARVRKISDMNRALRRIHTALIPGDALRIRPAMKPSVVMERGIRATAMRGRVRLLRGIIPARHHRPHVQQLQTVWKTQPAQLLPNLSRRQRQDALLKVVRN